MDCFFFAIILAAPDLWPTIEKPFPEHMKNLYTLLLCAALILFCNCINAQSTGFIIRQATSTAGSNVLDPVLKGYTSITAAGFGNDDVANSEIPFKPIPAFSTEPFGTAANKDLRRGADHLYSDFVPDAAGRGVYAYFDNTNLLFRMRLGTIVPGSKGYSILIDTDGRFGATGPTADPNFQPATTGINGNPGYEIEIVLETNFRIAIYNVDGTSNPVLVKAYNNWEDMSQVSIAGTNDNGDPDFLLDFYIPFSDLQAAPFNLTTSSSIRLSATTVMAPKAAIGGPRSDIYGVDGNNSEEDYINAQCSFNILSLQNATICPMCTQAPVLTGPIGVGTVNIAGTWTRSTLPGSYNRALIRIYKNGTLVATDDDSTTSGGSWSVSAVPVAANDVITARAHAAGESMCLNSNSVVVQSCNTTNIPANTGLTISCSSVRGLQGAFPAGHEVKVYYINPTTLVTSVLAGPGANSPVFGYNGSNWFYNGSSHNGNDIANACSGGTPDMSNGTYYVTAIAPGSSCESAPVFACIGIGTSTATPVITQTVLYNTSTTVSGTATADAQVRLRVNGQLIATTTATGGTYSFAGLKLNTGDVVEIRALTANNCISSAASLTVTCFTRPPLIDTDENNEITAGQPITGTSSEPAGTVIRVFATTNTSTPVATTTVQNNGTWSTGNAGTTPALFNAAAGASYFATAQAGSCGLSVASGNAASKNKTSGAKCGSITSPSPVGPSATSISGTLTGNTASVTVNLYLDGVKIGSATTSNNSWGPIAVNTVDQNTRLYSNGVLTIGIQETNMQEVLCPASATTITCTPTPAVPVISSSTNTTVSQGSTVSYTISNAVAGTFYALFEAPSGESLGAGQWATSNGELVLTTKQLSQARTYNVRIKATSISGLTVCSSTAANATINVSNTLPVDLVSFKGRKVSNGVLLEWIAENEINISRYDVERSSNGQTFTRIGSKTASGNTGRTTYSLLDADPLPSTNYYRLRIAEADGSFKHSHVVAIASNGRTVVVHTVRPNPFMGRLLIDISSTQNEEYQMQLIDESGRAVRQQIFKVSAGANSFSVSGLNELPTGVYILRLASAENSFQSKLLHVKQ